MINHGWNLLEGSRAGKGEEVGGKREERNQKGAVAALGSPVRKVPPRGMGAAVGAGGKGVER